MFNYFSGPLVPSFLNFKWRRPVHCIHRWLFILMGLTWNLILEVKSWRFCLFPGCMKEFNRPDKLKSHIISHSGIKPYKCPVCGKAFSRRPHMLEHERYHRNDYKFRCNSCGRGYNREKLFKAHNCKPRVSLHRKHSRTSILGSLLWVFNSFVTSLEENSQSMSAIFGGWSLYDQNNL